MRFRARLGVFLSLQTLSVNIQTMCVRDDDVFMILKQQAHGILQAEEDCKRALGFDLSQKDKVTVCVLCMASRATSYFYLHLRACFFTNCGSCCQCFCFGACSPEILERALPFPLLFARLRTAHMHTYTRSYLNSSKCIVTAIHSSAIACKVRLQCTHYFVCAPFLKHSNTAS